MWERIKVFLREFRVELRKVTWPTRKDVMASTLIIVVTIAIVTFFLWGVDLFLSRALDFVLK